MKLYEPRGSLFNPRNALTGEEYRQALAEEVEILIGKLKSWGWRQSQIKSSASLIDNRLGWTLRPIFLNSFKKTAPITKKQLQGVGEKTALQVLLAKSKGA